MKRCGSSVFGSMSSKRRKLNDEDRPQATWDLSSDDEDEDKKEMIVDDPEPEPEWVLHEISLEIDTEELHMVAQQSDEEQAAFLKTKEEAPDEYFLWETLIYGKYNHTTKLGSKTGLHVATLLSQKKKPRVLDKFARKRIDKSKVRVIISSSFAENADGKEQTNMLEISINDQIQSIFANVPNHHKKTTQRPHSAKRYSFVCNGISYMGVCLWWGQRPYVSFLEAAFYVEEPEHGGNGFEFAERGSIPPEDILVVELGRIVFVEEADEM